MDSDLKSTWKDCLESIKVSVSAPIFSTWISQTQLTNLTKKGERYLAEVGCNSTFVKTYLETRYFGLIVDTLSKQLGAACDLSLSVASTDSVVTKPIDSTPLFSQIKTDSEVAYDRMRTGHVRPNLRFDNFAVSSSNQMAWAAAEAVAKTPGSAYNPLFIWGGVGVGKTHLMNAVGVEIIKANPETSVLLCTSEDFTNQIVEGIKTKTTPTFRNKFRNVDILLIDDIQFIAGKDTVQEEFFHTFNALVGAGRQVVMTSDKPPSEISKLEERLRSRFEAGLIVDVAPPDFELRSAIVEIKAKERGIELTPAIAQLVAGNIESARALEGFLVKLTSEALIHKSEITQELVVSMLKKKDGTKEEEGKLTGVTSDQVLSAVSKYFSVGKRALLGECRKKQIVVPRQILMYFLRTKLDLPYDEVGRLVGGRDHSTVMHAVDKITALASVDVHIRENIKGIKDFL